MSEQEEIKLYDKIAKAIWRAQKKMLERKAKLGEPVVVAGADGEPIRISAEEALKLYDDTVTEGD